jgi:flavin-dependent dehydrogenase
VDRKKLNPRYGEMHILKGGYIGLDPTGNHEVNLSLVCNAQDVSTFGGTRDCFNHYLQQSDILMNDFGLIPKNVKISAVWPITNNIHHRLIENVALVGDAAGFIDPLTGEGIYNALWMAYQFTSLVKKYGDPNIASEKFLQMKKDNFRQKTLLNKFFQVIIKYPVICELIAIFLGSNKKRGDHFVGIIGNIHTPLVGLTKIMKG